MKSLLITIVGLGLCFEVFANGRSEEMIRMLEAPVPEWMSLAEPIIVEQLDDKTLPEGYPFRPRSGGATNSRNRVQIPERGLEFSFDYSITWRGGSNEGHGVSLSPDGRKLLVNSGTTPHLYEITPNGDLQEIPLKLPNVTFDEGVKGFVTGWSWAGNDVVVGRATITDDTGHEPIESRIYVFHMKEQALARLDLTALDLPPDSPLEVVSIGEDLEHLRISVGEREIAVKADLKAPPRLLAEQPTTRRSSSSNSSTSQSESSATSHSNGAGSGAHDDEQASSKHWFVTALLVLIGIALLRLFWAKKHE